MKTPRLVLLALLFAGASALCAADVPTMDVTVSDSHGDLAYRGKTNAQGTFATSELAPGKYVVQFNTKNSSVQEGNFALVVSAGKQKVIAEAVDGDKFVDGGVAMRVPVGRGLNITGQVASEDANGVATMVNGRMKIMNGRPYVWLENETGTQMGGHWVEAGSGREWNVTQLSNAGVQDLQERGSQRSEPTK